MAHIIEQREILILLLVHLLLGTRSLILLTAEVEYTVYDHTQHLLTCRCSIEACIVAYGFDIDEDIACDITLFEVAIIEGYDVGEVVVTEELDIHCTMTLCRAEYIVHLGNFEVVLL